MHSIGGLLKSSTIGILLSTFIASSVEMVEMSTIVLGVGTTRGWRSTLIGGGVGAAILFLIIIILGPQISRIPIHWLRLIVGFLLLSFGLNWLRKAIVRIGKGGGEEEEGKTDKRKKEEKFGITDWYSFTLAFKGTLLEGLEIVFIVLTFGAAAGNFTLSFIGGGAAVIIVGIAAFLVKEKISEIPNRILKFIVGVLLTTFGTFWASKGVYVQWPGQNISLIVLAAFFLVVAYGYVLTVKKGMIRNI